MPSLKKINHNIVIRTISVSAIIVLLAIGLYFSIKINPHSFSWIVAVIVNISLAIFVYLRNKNNAINVTFALMGLYFSIWAFAVFGLHIVDSAIAALYWSRIAFFTVFFIPSGFLHFVLVLTRSLTKTNKKILYLSYGIAVIFLILNWMGLFVTEFIKVGVKYTPKAETPYIIWMLNFVFWLFYGLLILLSRYRTTEDARERNQIKYLFIAASIAIIFSLTNGLLSFRIKVYPLGGVAAIIYPSIVAYAIVKHQLMDIRVAISKGLVYATLVGVITATYILTVGVFQGILGSTLFKQVSFFVNALAAMIIAATFQPLKNRIHFTVDKIFFKEKYNPQKILKEFTWALSSLIEADKISNLLINTATENLHIAKSSVFLAEKESGKLKINTAKGLPARPGNEETIEKIYFEKDEFLPQWLKEKNKIFIREEFEFRLARQEFNPTEEITQILNKLKELEADLSIPLKIKDELVGIFNLSNKMSGEMFTPEDLELFTTLANQAAIAIENARLYEEMRELEKNLHRADKLTALGTLASNIAHEIKNPLVAIKTFTQLFPEKFNDPEFQKKYNQIVPRELERLEDILHELLNFSRPAKEVTKPVEVKKVIDEILLFMDNEISKNGVRIIKEYQENLPKILTNPDQMKQVFLNLILNALQAMPEGGSLKISARMVIPTNRQDDIRESKFVEIRFSDTGYGIPEENLKNLFKPFFSTKEDGTGLGLAIVKQIIKDHNGTIEVVSTLNQGTTFQIKLPLVT